MLLNQTGLYPNINQVGEIFTDEPTRIKIRKHINDINDTISEDDIRNVRTTFYSQAARFENNINSNSVMSEVNVAREINSWNIKS